MTGIDTDGNLYALRQRESEREAYDACREAALDEAYERAADHKIIVSYERPPIPNADHFTAYSDDLGGDDSPYGHGPDAASAIDDLTDQLAELEMKA